MKSLSSNSNDSWLSWFLRGVLILLFLVLFAKLIEVQIIKGEYYRNLSDQNRIRRVTIPAPRGRILARGGEVIAGNIETKKRIVFDPSGFTLTDDLNGASNEEIINVYQRYYPMGDKFSHALGYLSKVNDSEIGKINPNCPQKGPRMSDALVGKTGLEESYDCLLTGVSGEEIIEVDAAGKKIRTLGKKDPVAGKDLQTTIDYGLQNQVADDMDGKKGAAIVTDINGQILAFYSYPSFDPNIFINKGNSDEIGLLLKDENMPFFDRVISGPFPPGSEYNPLVAISALEEGAVDGSFIYNDTGVITVNNYSYTNWYFTENGRTEGPIGLVKAIARSTDTFFYTIGQMVGPDTIAKWAGYFGLNALTGVDIPGEAKGLIPTPNWKKSTKKESWFLGNTYHMSIGQGDVAVTPIEINTYITALAAGGNLCQPRFDMYKNQVCRKVKISANTESLVKQGMTDACTSGGTAYTFFDFSQKHNGINVACKTGTAEVSTDGTPHAWFTFFAPNDKPQIVATVLIEKGGQGSSVAGPIARNIADYYFQSFAK